MTESELKDRFRKAAQRLYHEDGQTEIDDTAEVSLSLNEEGEHHRVYQGAYVQAWIWVEARNLDPKDGPDRVEAEPDKPTCTCPGAPGTDPNCPA